MVEPHTFDLYNLHNLSGYFHHIRIQDAFLNYLLVQVNISNYH